MNSIHRRLEQLEHRLRGRAPLDKSAEAAELWERIQANPAAVDLAKRLHIRMAAIGARDLGSILADATAARLASSFARQVAIKPRQ